MTPLVLEVAILNVRPDENESFEATFAEAQAILEASGGYRGHELRRCHETEGRYLLLVWWTDLESHTRGFRESPAYARWSELSESRPTGALLLFLHRWLQLPPTGCLPETDSARSAASLPLLTFSFPILTRLRRSRLILAGKRTS